MPPPCWLAPLTRALDAGVAVSPAARFLQVATVRPDGRPAVRTVVFRGWFDEGGRGGPRLGFVTDARTEKVAHLTTNPAAEACWYFRETRDQFRLAGTLAIVDAGDADAATMWARISPAAREWYAGPAPGSVKIEGDGEVGARASSTSAPAAEVRGGGGGNGGPPLPPNEHFRLVLLDVDSVDHVALEEDRRWQYRRAGGEWEKVEVNP